MNNFFSNEADFTSYVQKNIKEYLKPEHREAEIKVMSFPKVNYGERTGLIFKMPGTEKSPILYPDESFKEVVNGDISIEKAMINMADAIDHGIEEADNVVSFQDIVKIFDWNTVKSLIEISAVGKKRNMHLLRDIPYRESGDICCTYRIILNEGSILIKNDMMKNWGKSEEDLFNTACSNMAHLPILMNMEDALEATCRGGNPNEDRNLLEHPEKVNTDGSCQLFVLTNTRMAYGAGVIFIPGILEKISEVFKRGFYLIPSSIHELLIMPDDGNIIESDINRIIEEVNTNEVAAEEQLSDHVFYYDRETKALTAA